MYVLEYVYFLYIISVTKQLCAHCVNFPKKVLTNAIIGYNIYAVSTQEDKVLKEVIDNGT